MHALSERERDSERLCVRGSELEGDSYLGMSLPVVVPEAYNSTVSVSRQPRNCPHTIMPVGAGIFHWNTMTGRIALSSSIPISHLLNRVLDGDVGHVPENCAEPKGRHTTSRNV
jgi:hypothetical protein